MIWRMIPQFKVMQECVDWVNRILREGGAQSFPQWLYAEPGDELTIGLELKVVVAIALSDRGDDSDVVALGADVVCRRDDSDVDV